MYGEPSSEPEVEARSSSLSGLKKGSVPLRRGLYWFMCGLVVVVVRDQEGSRCKLTENDRAKSRPGSEVARSRSRRELVRAGERKG
jgi:hypothetical protein